MCGKCKNISCSGCSGKSSVVKYSSELIFNGVKFVCSNGWTIAPNQSLNKTLFDFSTALCELMNRDGEPKNFAIKQLPDGWDQFLDPAYPAFLNNWYIILQVTNGVPSSIIVDSTFAPGDGTINYFAIDRNNCQEEVSVDFINMPSGFTNGGGDGKITIPFSTWEFPADRRTLEFDGTTPVGVYQFDLQLSTANCGTVLIPYILAVNP